MLLSSWSKKCVCGTFSCVLLLLAACGSHTETNASGPGPDFSLALSPTSLSIEAGTAQSLTVTVSAQNNFTGSVQVAISGLPSGVTAAPSTLNMTSGVPQKVTLTADANAAASDDTVTFTATSGMLSHAAMLSLKVTSVPPPAEDFSLSVTPSSLMLTAGATGESLTVNAAPVNGFSDPVNVSFSGLPAGVTISPSTLTLTPGSPQNIVLTAAANASLGTVSVTVTGVSGSLSHTSTVALTVVAAPPPADFTIAIKPTALALTAGAGGQAVTVTISAVNGFTGRVDVALAGLPAGVTASPSTLSIPAGSSQSLTLTAAANAHIGSANITVTCSSGSLSHTAILALSVASPPPAADFSLTATPGSLSIIAGLTGLPVSLLATAGNGFTGSVAVSVSGLPAGVTASPSTLNLTPGVPQNVTLTAAANAAVGKATVTFTGKSGALTHTAAVALTVAPAPPPPDFTLSVNPQSLTLTAGASGQQIAVSAAAQNGFTGTVNVSVSGLPSGVTPSPSTLTLTPGTPQNMTLTAASGAATGKVTVTFTGATSPLTHTATLALTVNPTPPVVVDVTTYHYDNSRTGLNANESKLILANVNSTGFGKVGFYPTDGKVDAEPLYLSGFTVNGETHNVLYVVTEHDSAYAFDADSGSILWQKSVLASGESSSDDHSCNQISPEIGITDTPVIDRTHGAIFFVAMTVDGTGAYHHRLHALSLTTGAEIEGGPTEISASFPGTGYGSQNGVQTFDPAQYAERVGLLLMNGSLFLGWTSHCDRDPYTGWLMMYDEATLHQKSVLNLTPNSTSTVHYNDGEGSIWMAGAGLAGDSSGNVYFLDANGSFDTDLDGSGMPAHGDYGNAFMKVSSSNGKLTPADYFSTFDTVTDSIADRDFGSGGALLLPDVTDATGKTRHLAVGAGKDGNIYVVDRDNLGKFNPNGNQNYQEVSGTLSSEFGMAAYFNSTVYYGSINNVLQAFPLQAGKLATASSSQTSTVFTFPGTTPGVSANGGQNGIVWAVENSSPAVLHAYDASSLDRELYNSNQAARGRDNFGNGNKFITPMIVNGKVYIGTPTGVAVFGLLK
ncbi:hypothetical protein [Acidobacterium sp. S8]|uniref:hypothetical protein n=1 Tax=Acidobacterium sp. S8 TaxID=1641854 RepID=UPI0020B17540|nr:hypothetical protein [Acidobacterium sp. S8]